MPPSSAAQNFWEYLENLTEDLSSWSQRTFGADNVRGPAGAIRHLMEEAEEALVELESGGSSSLQYREELADCFMLLLDICRRSGLALTPMASLDQLIWLTRQKLEVNKGREWGKPSSNDQPVHHTGRMPKLIVQEVFREDLESRDDD